MKQPLLVLDVHYLCHRAFHTTGELEWKSKPTGVIFGFLKSIVYLKDEFQTDRIAFCFDHPHLFRRDIYPGYKRKRIRATQRTEEEREAYLSLHIQISELRQRYLPKIGFKNIFRFKGMESDDIMASIAFNTESEVVLVTADRDLWQCLRSNVSIYSPQKRRILTSVWFEREYGLDPRKWARVKALSGCSSDEVKGIKGVGEHTAIKYLKGELNSGMKVYQSIVSRSGRSVVKFNRRLVKLPFDECPIPTIQKDNVTKKNWIEVCGMIGMKSFASHPPIATRKLGV